MKKYFICAFVLMMLLAFSACGSLSDTLSSVQEEIQNSSVIENSSSQNSKNIFAEEEKESFSSGIQESSSVASTIEDPDFRNVKWGMSKEEVKRYAQEELTEADEGFINIETELLEKKVALLYQFNDKDQLYQAAYSSLEEHTNKNLYLEDYEQFKESLIEKYGQPSEDEEFWRSNLYRDNPGDYGMAVAVGDLVKRTTWETDNTKIVLGITGDNFEIGVVIVYFSKEITPPTDNNFGI